ncbi:MAG: HmuY family protein [Gemmatimonadetes bacterium]|nr:HmuY family protein [Gemmatimonadota bacterium]
MPPQAPLVTLLTAMSSPHSPTPSPALPERTPRGVATAQIVLFGTLAIFVLLIGYLIVAAMIPKEAAVYPPSAVAPRAPTDTLVQDTVTIDASDPAAWRFFDFDRQSVVLPPDTVGWDLAVRRFTLVAADAVADLGVVGFDDVRDAADAPFVLTTFGRDTVNAAIDRWYHYSMLTHLMKPAGHVYIVRTTAGRFAKMQLLGYYCPGMVGGCPTFRYVYQPVSGSPLVHP